MGYQHYVTANSCTAITGPDGGADDGSGGDPGGDNGGDTGGGDNGTGNPGGGSTADNPTSTEVNLGGTFTNANGTTNVNLTMNQDFSPITSRINETNSRLRDTNVLLGSIKSAIESLESSNDSNQAIQDLLTDIKSAVEGINLELDTTGLESALGDIAGALDGLANAEGTDTGRMETLLEEVRDTLRTGSYEGGLEFGESVNLPDANTIISNYNQVIAAIDSDENLQLTERFTNISDTLNSFDSVQGIFDFAGASCSPIYLGRHELDLCGAAGYSRSVLNWVVSVLLIIFLVKSITSDLKRIRIT